MPINYGYAEEETLKSSGYDIKMIRWLFPFFAPYRRLLILSIALVSMITLLDLSLPYLTKIAVDRYIVPVTGEQAMITVDSDASAPSKEKRRIYRVDASDPENVAIIRKYPALFRVTGTEALIDFEHLAELSKNDLAVLRKDAVTGVGLVALLFVILAVADFVMSFFQKLVVEISGHKIMHDIRMRLFDHIQHLSISFFNKNPVGRLVTRATNDVQNMHELFSSVISFIFQDIFLLIGIAVVLLTIHWRLALITFAVLPFVCWAALKFARKARHIFRVLRAKIAEINTRFSETIEGMRVVQLFQLETENNRIFHRLNHDTYLMGMAQIQVMAVFLPLIELIGVAAVAAAISFGGAGVLNESISLGALVAFLSYIRMFFRPIRDIAEKYNVLQNALASVERISLIMDSKEKLPLPPGNDGSAAEIIRPSAQPLSEIRFDRVSFEYVKAEPVLKNVSFSISAGETLGVVGPTGAGKTSLINLVIRFYDPTEGSVQINGVNLSQMPPDIFLEKISLVPQDPFLFAGTIRENILQGIKTISDEEMAAILSAANCNALVERSTDGLDTILPSGGGSISSGERQLISIARAFARDPELIILDEATSHIDSGTEHQIQQALANLLKDRTAIVVAHRLATVRNLDRILVLHKGRVMETGSHTALMAKKGFYYRLNTIAG
ncbi:MAG: ABC transporter ATP-binding protein [Candidatus Cloacimonadaceae bacterium]|jgi:ATP-binding cassette subfamily B protein|nr:ABC transporter ATP-binding protein [Candidatus Cloacimonadaceae bacterium]